MAFWLARERRGQHCCYIQRFDPRFWTVNFPRPMMASVVSTAADALRVDCSFYHKGELAGLIWESEDRLDHPLLAYETQRNYAHCILKFRWRSGGVIVLDQPHGPTLTIEGRDAAGNARAWYVRLWNYASGTPNDALIELPFSALQSGYGLPGEPVHPSDIDRMFISLVPQGYVEGSTEQLPARVDGWAEMSGLSCEGAHASLETGDVLLPAHGEQIATAYDDSFN
ncbi:MAG: TIGR02217 family protein, partial [Pseudomonadota bacterium]|nr:TIGR02217 family protein [Pseudomonadota bacterium]